MCEAHRSCLGSATTKPTEDSQQRVRPVGGESETEQQSFSMLASVCQIGKEHNVVLALYDPVDSYTAGYLHVLQTCNFSKHAMF